MYNMIPDLEDICGSIEYVYILSINTLTDIFLEKYIINYKQQFPVSGAELKNGVGRGRKQ